MKLVQSQPAVLMCLLCCCARCCYTVLSRVTTETSCTFGPDTNFHQVFSACSHWTCGCGTCWDKGLAALSAANSSQLSMKLWFKESSKTPFVLKLKEGPVQKNMRRNLKQKPMGLWGWKEGGWRETTGMWKILLSDSWAAVGSLPPNRTNWSRFF